MRGGKRAGDLPLSQEIGGKLEIRGLEKGAGVSLPPPPRENVGKWKIIGEKRVEDIFPSTETGGK